VVYRRSASPGAISTPETLAAGGFAARLCRAGRGTKWSGSACSDRGAVKRRGQNAGLVDRMTHSPLDDPDRLAPLYGRRRARATWLAFLALLGNILLPAALSIIVLKEPGRDIPGVGLCGHWPGDAPGKAKPGLLVQHCPLCTVPAAPLPRPPSIVVPGKLADESRLQLLRTVSVAPIRHSRMQARAPPSVV
jgi:hypothetical protein